MGVGKEARGTFLQAFAGEAFVAPRDMYAKNLTWIPLSERQKQKFAEDPPAPVHPDILITKLRPGQEIELVGFLEKGLGKTHAKWSPVATAVYRLEPEFVFTKPIEGEEAEELKELCPMDVFDIEDAISIESTCAIPAPKLFKMALEVLKEKAITFREIIRTKQLE
ncbi:DNA-directed RNA polymerases I and III subunit RPAC1 [Cyclospora cayetanensis]|uniref:DNA-directed RNA polymerases I and III subunit RPAC1 n=1 Tax=Cyclospora cayetanensis TaxID=88456 RepID=A0A6P6S190_9EIME|nr:DNA-directed RNA polymerases I and III subunit RPAC1 [Cyclospora cayetanensis]